MIMKKQFISSGTPWEKSVGYSRAIRIGNQIEISGTTAMDGDQIVAPGNATLQTAFIFEKINKTLQEAGASMNDIIRTRMFVTNMNDWEAIGSVHGKYLHAIRPAATMVEVNQLIHPDLVIEIEVTAIIQKED